MMKNKCVVVIPVYKDNPSRTEIASFRQGISILKSYDVFIFTYIECNLDIYKRIAGEQKIDLSIEFFEKKYFSSIEGYNDLCFSKDFYHRFSVYEYMFIYQLDAWVFRDELQFWCDKGYDYIGAPIYYGKNRKTFTTKFFGVGNGGLCLRKISHCLSILEGNSSAVFLKPISLIKLYWNYFLYSDNFKNIENRIKILPIILAKFFGKYNSLNYYIKNHVNEDLIFGTWSTKSWGHKGNIPTEDEAMHFSFEVNPSFLYNKIGEKLPFGCHAFEKWEYETFWKQFINL